MYKKIYVEITNNCNLNCDFCIHNERPKKFMNIDEFKTVLEKLKFKSRALLTGIPKTGRLAYRSVFISFSLYGYILHILQ